MLKPGEIVDLSDRRDNWHVVERVTECSAFVVPLEKKERTFTTWNGEVITFGASSRGFHISPSGVGLRRKVT